MGSRAVLVVCRDGDTAAQRFAAGDGKRGRLRPPRRRPAGQPAPPRIPRPEAGGRSGRSLLRRWHTRSGTSRTMATGKEHLDRLRGRSVKRKRSLALREYALGLEGLHRFVEREPLYRVHECAFGVLALESEPVDPRLWPGPAPGPRPGSPCPRSRVGPSAGPGSCPGAWRCPGRRSASAPDGRWCPPPAGPAPSRCGGGSPTSAPGWRETASPPARRSSTAGNRRKAPARGVPEAPGGGGSSDRPPVAPGTSRSVWR